MKNVCKDVENKCFLIVYFTNSELLIVEIKLIFISLIMRKIILLKNVIEVK